MSAEVGYNVGVLICKLIALDGSYCGFSGLWEENKLLLWRVSFVRMSVYLLSSLIIFIVTL